MPYSKTLTLIEPAWAGYQTLPADLVDILVEQCDAGFGNAVSQMVYTYWVTAEQNPFSVFAARQMPSVRSQPLHSISKALASFSSEASIEPFLFHHYVEHVAALMLPYQHPRNAFETQYPSAALESASAGKKGLYFAILAQAAFNLAQLRNNDAAMLYYGAKYYGKSMRELSRAIERQDIQFPTMLSSIMTLMFAEVWAQLFSFGVITLT